VKRWFVLALAAVGILTVAAVALASNDKRPEKFKTSLDSRQETPRPQSVSTRASGKFNAELNGVALSWNLKFDHLTGKATAAHIHTGARGKAGPVLIPLCAPCAASVKGVAKLTAAQVKALDDAKLYVNVHTVKNPAGEIRGQLR
jgi:CHRD domain-containing protein